MEISNSELRQLIIQPTLKLINQSHEQAENFLIIAARACHLGSPLPLSTSQEPNMGIYGISPSQHRALWDTYLIHHHELASQVRGLASQREFLLHPDEELITNLRYATAIAWLLIRQHLEAKNLPLENAVITDVIKTVFERQDCDIAA